MDGKTPNQKDIYRQITDRIIEQLHDHQLTLDKPWVCVGMDGQLARNAETQNVYKGINQILLGYTADKNGYPLNHWMTFNQIKNLGGMVKNGEKSTPVIAHIREFRHYNGYKLQDHEVEDMGGLEAARKLGFDEKAYNVLHKVFNVDQTQGLPQQFYEVKSVDFPGLFKRDELAEKLIKNTGAAIEYSVSNRAFYSPISDTIQMPVHEQFKGQEPFYETVLHELGHWTGHKSRLDRLDKINSPKGHAKEELVAELTSTFLCAELGFSKPISNNVSYIQSWMKELENDKRLVVKAAREAEIASAYVWELHRQKELDNDRSKDKEAEQVAPAPEATGMGNYTVEPRGRLFSENYSLYLHQKELARKEVKALSRDER